MENKKGFMRIIIFIGILFLIMIIGVIASVVVGVFDMVGDEVTPMMNDFGMIGNTNVSHYSEVTFGQANNFMQSLPWMVGIGYVMLLIFSIIFVVSYRSNPSPVFIGVYVVFALFLILGSIFISNIYENLYSGGDDLSTRLQEQTILSYLILYSPMVMSIIVFITGIFLFTKQEDNYI